MTTTESFSQSIELCRQVFVKKMADYGTAWRIMRPQSITDQIFIKANRIRKIEIGGIAMISESIQSELIGIINYAIIGLIQLEMGVSDTPESLCPNEALNKYNYYAEEAKKLMEAKNHDYDEAWRSMRPESYTDLILMKIHRVKQIESNKGKTIVSEGIDANYFDMINYAIFGLIKMQNNEKR